MSQLTDLPAWQNLVNHFEKTKDVHMRDLFAQDPGQHANLTLPL